MKRLPRYDNETSRSELRFFLALGLAAVFIIVITIFDSARFSIHRDEIATALSNPGTALAGAPTNTSLTNLAVIRSGTTDERARLSAAAKPKS